MKAAPSNRPVKIPAEIAAKCDGPDQFEKFDRLFRGVIAVPKAALEKEEKKWKQKQKRKREKKSS
jgi:hypothetical protein